MKRLQIPNRVFVVLMHSSDKPLVAWRVSASDAASRPEPDFEKCGNCGADAQENRLPLWAKRIIWHLDGSAGRSIRFWINVQRARYVVGVGIAKRVCRGNRYGVHTAHVIQPLGGECFCDRVRRRLDFIPF